MFKFGRLDFPVRGQVLYVNKCTFLILDSIIKVPKHSNSKDVTTEHWYLSKVYVIQSWRCFCFRSKHTVDINITIRKANDEEIHWVNEQYQRVGFKLSSFETDLVAIALIDGQKVGLGRIQKITDYDAELGGIYVSSDFRGIGIAAKLVTFLVENTAQYRQVYCLPFEHLAAFYEKFGFEPVSDSVAEVPDLVLSKHHWCNEIYDQTTLLFVKHNTDFIKRSAS